MMRMRLLGVFVWCALLALTLAPAEGDALALGLPDCSNAGSGCGGDDPSCVCPRGQTCGSLNGGTCHETSLPLPPPTASIKSCDDGGTVIEHFKVATTPPNETDVPAAQDTVAHVCWDDVGLHIRENAAGRARRDGGLRGAHFQPPGRRPTPRPVT
jgi:hypothetical protein